MTDATACIRGCAIPERHAGCADPDTCPGCLPAPCDSGSLLCRVCEARLGELLGDTHEGIEWITYWLADNLGQHVNHIGALGGRDGNPDSRMDRLVAVASVMSEMQIAIMEITEDFAEHHGITPPARQDGHMAALELLRRWSGTLRRWEPVGDAIDELLDLRSQAHAVAPWRPQHGPQADQYAAVATFQAPPETTEEVCKRFGITAERLRQAKRRGKVTPTGVEGRELLWRPWDVFTWLHPAEAQDYLDDMPNWQLLPEAQGAIVTNDVTNALKIGNTTPATKLH